MAFSGANMFALLDDEDGPPKAAAPRAPAQAAAKPVARAPAKPAAKSGTSLSSRIDAFDLD
jgi:hypothetical protein